MQISSGQKAKMALWGTVWFSELRRYRRGVETTVREEFQSARTLISGCRRSS